VQLYAIKNDEMSNTVNFFTIKIYAREHNILQFCEVDI